jgi:hypothetical protein
VQDILTMLTVLKRPRLLMRAARIGAEEYRRDRHLQRILGYGSAPRPAPALLKLMEMEAAINTQRISDDASYSLVRHVDILIAMMGEARLLRASQSV